ncbi:MAG: hypothetical protein AAF766_17305 [Cyanobacteria bacterium P01_D01_bin.14]
MSLTPLQRLQVNDGLLITADRWQIAHGYHQQRQKIHYEALHQGGIVSGLGVSVGPVPEAASSKYRQPRWLTIQPGLAIDTWGNPIVVAHPESCYLSAQLTETTTIYIVLKHSDLSASERTGPDADIVQEAFQILEKNGPAEPGEIELCRVRLTPEATEILSPEDVFNPREDQLDLRYRQPVRVRSQRHATVSAWSPRSAVLTQFQSLFQALPGLYPALQAQAVKTSLQSDLTCIDYADFTRLSRSNRSPIADYLRQGGTLLVQAASEALGSLYQVEAELRSAVAAGRLGTAGKLQAQAEQELADVQVCLHKEIETLAQPLRAFLDAEDLPAAGDGALTDSELITTPFAFSQLPTLHGIPIGLYSWGGLLLLVGPLPQVWSGYDLPRHELRDAQELGINLLHFAARRRQMHTLLASAAE